MLRTRVSGGLLVVAIGASLLLAGWGRYANRAEAQPSLSSASSQVITVIGTDDHGNFQAALDDALGQADAFFGHVGADIRYAYDVKQTTGLRGGFAFLNEVNVTIVARGG